MRSLRTRHPCPVLPALACVILVAGCDSAGTGGGAGDGDESPAAIALLAPFEGIYDLQDDWNGQSGDEAFLSIEAPGADAIAPAEFYDYDDFSNCLPDIPFEGELSKDLFSNRVFMDGIPQFNEAILTLSEDSLTIEFNDDGDLDNDGSTQDRVSVSATRVEVSQISDLGQPC